MSAGKRARALATLALVAASLACAVRAEAYGTIACSTNPAYRYTYPNDAVWPLAFFANVPPGDGWRASVDAAMGTWNAVYGAFDELATGGESYGYCQPPENAGFGAIGWDDGSCYDWGANETGVQVFWDQDCIVTRSVVYFNVAKATTYAELQHVAVHELGHYQYYAHNWYEISNMGYTWSNTPAMTFLTAADQAYLRLVFPSGNVAPPDLHIHRFELVDDIQPGILSYEQAADPQCSGDCFDLRQGDTITAELSFGNTGATPTGQPVVLRMYLGGHSIGEWATNGPLDAHSEGTFAFTGVVAPGIPAGFYDLEVWIDPDDEIAEYGGPSASNVVVFPGFHLQAPSDWHCDPYGYGAGDMCDCACGAYDPDCDAPQAEVAGCAGSNEPCKAPGCSAEGTCVVLDRSGPCDDGRFCTVGDTCSGGVCVGAPRDCSLLDAACASGRCDEASAACVSEPRQGDPGCGGGGPAEPGALGGDVPPGHEDGGCACRAGPQDRGRDSAGDLSALMALLVAAMRREKRREV